MFQTLPRISFLLLMAASACTAGGPSYSSDAQNQEDAGANVDASQELGVGLACPTNQCPSSLLCLDETWLEGFFPEDGYCSVECTDDDECGPGAFCSGPIDGFGSPKICVATCDSEACIGDDRTCHTNFEFPLGGDACLPGNPNGRDGDPCALWSDCAEGSECAADAFAWPGGFCRSVSCTVGDDSTCHGGTCTLVGALNECLVSCTGDGDCRESEGYRCLENACTFPTKEVGDACSTNDPCADPTAGTDWICLDSPSATFPGGFCSAMCTTGDDCPQGSGCYGRDVAEAGGNYCATACGSDAACRQSEGYTCENILTVDSGSKMVPAKVCTTNL